MKAINLLLKTFTLILLLTGMKTSFADTQGGALSSSPYATQSWIIHCFDDGRGVPSNVYFDVRASSAKRKFGVTATLSKDGNEAPVNDLKSGDKFSSPGATLNGGDGDYVMRVIKAKPKDSQPDSILKGAGPYAFTYHCQSATGEHTGTTIGR